MSTGTRAAHARMLVTGASGLLGPAVMEAALARGHRVCGVCHLHPVRIPGVEMTIADLARFDNVRRVFDWAAPDCVVHCAAAAGVDWCEDHPDQARQINADMAGLVADAAAAGRARFVQISTDSVFCGDRGGYAETDPPAPVNVYAQTKLNGERAVLERLPSALVVRTSIYGWNIRSKKSLAEWILAALERQEEVPGFTDVRFSPILVGDLADLILDAVGKRLTGLYHITGGEACSKYEFARTLAEVFGFDVSRVQPRRIEDAPLRAPRPKDISLDTRKAARDLGRSMPGVRDGVLRFREQRDSGYAARLKTFTGEDSHNHA